VYPLYPQPPTQLYPFAFPGQFIGAWISFDPTAGSYTYDAGTGYALGYIWIPTLTDAVQIFVGDTATGSPIYTTGTGGAEGIPLPSGTLAVTLLSVDGTGAVMPVYLTSLTFDPIKTTVTAPAVASVTATAPLVSSGGANPNISLIAPLAVGYGGTGTASPSLVAGAGIAISGTWPNQTVGSTSSAGVTSVGANAPLSSSGGTTPIISLTGIVPVAQGGTGTASPSLVAGANVTITGAWPNQTVAAAAVTASQFMGTNGSFTLGELPLTMTLPTLPGSGSWVVEAWVNGIDFSSTGTAELAGGGAGVNWNGQANISNTPFPRFLIIGGTAIGGQTPSATVSSTGAVRLTPGQPSGLYSIRAWLVT